MARAKATQNPYTPSEGLGAWQRREIEILRALVKLLAFRLDLATENAPWDICDEDQLALDKTKDILGVQIELVEAERPDGPCPPDCPACAEIRGEQL